MSLKTLSVAVLVVLDIMYCFETALIDIGLFLRGMLLIMSWGN